MADPFENIDHVDAPARRMFLITKHDTNPVDPIPKAIRANEGGTIALRAVGSGADVSITVAAGEIIPVRASHVRSTGTTVTNIHGFV